MDLLGALGDSNETARTIAVNLCGQLKEHAKTLVPPLLSMLDEGQAPAPGAGPRARSNVPGALVSLAGDDPVVRGRILKAIEDGDPWVRMEAIGALVKLGENRTELREALTRVLNENGPIADLEDYHRVREFAADRLISIGHPDLVLGALHSPDKNVRSAAVRTLGSSRPEVVRGAREALEALLIDEKDADVAGEAKGVLEGPIEFTPGSP
jgi:HEAT repeat protein